MVTKKAAPKPSILKFKIDWVKDPMPDLRKVLDRAAIQKLDALKKDFGAKVNAIIKSGQR
jgi:hypothetical protein